MTAPYSVPSSTSTTDSDDESTGDDATETPTGEQKIDDAVFEWSVNDESTGGSYFGGCNYLAAGAAGDAEMARIWTAKDAGSLFKTDGSGNFTDGNVSIVKDNGRYSTFESRCETGGGDLVNGKVNAEADGNHTGDSVRITNGKGTVDPEKNNASIQWEGSWTFAYYGGMTYWTITDPALEIENGKGTITGTYSGYGADMDDLSKWQKLSPVDGDIVEIRKGEVDVTEDGFEFTPDFSGSARTRMVAMCRLRRRRRTNPGGEPCLRTGSTSTSRPGRTRTGIQPPGDRIPSSRGRRPTRSQSPTISRWRPPTTETIRRTQTTIRNSPTTRVTMARAMRARRTAATAPRPCTGR
jgi:hypothetical protein